jgi:hypothetical protein
LASSDDELQRCATGGSNSAAAVLSHCRRRRFRTRVAPMQMQASARSSKASVGHQHDGWCDRDLDEKHGFNEQCLAQSNKSHIIGAGMMNGSTLPH